MESVALVEQAVEMISACIPERECPPDSQMMFPWEEYVLPVVKVACWE